MGEAVGVIAVVGACGPERLQYAKRLARVRNRAFFPALRLVGSPDPAHEAAVLASWTDPAVGAVVELPDEVPAMDLIGAFTDREVGARLIELICVVDAVHLLDDLHRDGYLPLRDVESGVSATLTARAQLAVWQLEYASTIVFVGWESLTTGELAEIMALVSHLSPLARLRLKQRAMTHVGLVGSYTPDQRRPGWVGVLNGEFAPHMTDPQVSAVRYEQVRPLHPGRLMAVLDRIEAGDFGMLVRSAGFCRLATRPHVVAQ